MLQLSGSAQSWSLSTFSRSGNDLAVVNLYVPPAAARTFDFDTLSPLVNQPHLVFGADVNVHHPDWDPLRKADAAGKRLHAWLQKHGLRSFNDGSVTRVWNTTRSTPDVTFGRVTCAEELQRRQWCQRGSP